MGLHSLEKSSLRGEIIAGPQELVKGYTEGKPRLFSKATNTRCSPSLRGIKHRNKLPGEFMKSPSLDAQKLKRQLKGNRF